MIFLYFFALFILFLFFYNIVVFFTVIFAFKSLLGIFRPHKNTHTQISQHTAFITFRFQFFLEKIRAFVLSYFFYRVRNRV